MSKRINVVRKPEDAGAKDIEFGVELETVIPAACGIVAGPYHSGSPVVSAITPKAEGVTAPRFNGHYWRSDRDGSIRFAGGEAPSEFVSPILKGNKGVLALLDFVDFANRIGANVNKSCGCHITIGIRSVLGCADTRAIALFVRRLARVVDRYAWAIYAQTGTDRHLSVFASKLPEEAGDITNDLLHMNVDTLSQPDVVKLMEKTGRGIVNFRKAFHADRSKSAVEFRAFAGTLNRDKLLNHVATCFGLVRRAWMSKEIPPFHGRRQRKPKNAVEALFEMWEYLGWLEDGPGADCAFGQFGWLHKEFPNYAVEAVKKAELFERRFPKADL